jgi:hypothetical protein
MRDTIWQQVVKQRRVSWRYCTAAARLQLDNRRLAARLLHDFSLTALLMCLMALFFREKMHVIYNLMRFLWVFF